LSGCNGTIWLFQSTRPRGARLQDPTYLNELTVSIHAPTRGATNLGAVF